MLKMYRHCLDTPIVSLSSDNSHVSGGEKSRAAEEDIFL